MIFPTYTIGEVCEFVLDGTHGSPTRVETGIPVLSAQHVIDGKLNFETDRFTTEEEYKNYSRRFNLQKGDVLFTIVGTIGRSAVVSEVVPHVFQRSVAILRPKPKLISSEFLYHLTQSIAFKTKIDKFTNKSAQAGIYLGKLKEIDFNLPPLAEQQRIAALLDTADRILKQRESAIAKLDQLAQSVFVEMFEATNKNDTKWPVVQLGSAVQILSGYAFDSQNFKAEDGIKLIRIRDVIRGYSETYYSGDFDERYVVNEGDMLIGMDGEFNIAKWGKESALLNQRVCKITVTDERLSENYLFHFLPKQLKLIEDATPFVTVKHLSTKKINDIKIPLPPLHLQNKFLNKSYKIDDLRTKFLLTNDCVTRLIASLQHQSFAVN